MTPEEIRTAIAARPDASSLQQAAAEAAYAAALDAQERGLPSSVVAGILRDFAAEWASLDSTLSEIDDAR